MTLLCGWFVAGFFIDAYAHHNNLPESFFSPWHGILYAGFAATAGLTFMTARRGIDAGHGWRRAMPAGYAWAPVGVLVFLAGGLGDMAWHMIFGLENDVDALFSPTHLLLGIGAMLLAAAPLRAAWLEPKPLTARGWRSAWPAMLTLSFMVSIPTFFIQYADPFTEPWATSAGDAGSPKAQLYRMNTDGMEQLRLSYAAGVDDSSPAISPDGSQIAFMSDAGEGYALWLMQADGANRRLLLGAENAELYQPAWSPDGESIAFVRIGEQGDQHAHDHGAGEQDAHLWVMNSDGSDARPLTNGQREDWRPVFSPDGAWIAFHSRVAGNMDIYRVSTGGGIPERLSDDPADDYDATWSPDGSRIAFASEREGQSAIYAMPAGGGAAEPIDGQPGGAWQPRWSPDGNQIAFNRWADGDVDVWLMNSDGSQARNLSRRPGSHDGFADWTPDGSGLIFRSRPDGGGNQSYTSQAVGSMGILLHAAALMGVFLLAVSRWNLPAGSLLLVLALNGLAMGALENEWRMAAISLLAGLLIEALYSGLKRRAARSASEMRGLRPSDPTLLDAPATLRVFAFLVPAILFAVYLSWLGSAEGLGWTVHMWTGSFVMAGLVGVLMSFLVTGLAGLRPGDQPEPSPRTGVDHD